MSDISWIKLKIQMFDDEKVKIIESMPDGDSILIIWLKLLVQAGKTNANGYIFLNEHVPFTADMLATIFNRKIATVRMALEWLQKLGMIDVYDNGMILINKWDKHQNIEGLEKIREQARLRQQRHREGVKQLPEDVTLLSRDVTQQNKNKNKNKNKKKEEEYIVLADIDFVHITDDEYNKLIDAHGQEITTTAITRLDNYKGSTGKQYKSDYRAILSWVIDDVKSKIIKNDNNGNSKKSAADRQADAIRRFVTT